VSAGARRPLDDLLVPPLDGAIALEQVHQVSVEIAQDLDLDVARPAQELLGEHEVLAEGGARFTPCGLDQLEELGFTFHDAKPAPATAAAGLDHERIADRRREPSGLSGILRQGTGRGKHGHAHALGQLARGDLVAEDAQGLGARTDEDQARFGARVGELGLGSEKAVARVDRVHARPARHTHEVGQIDVRVDRRARGAHQVALVSREPVPRAAVLLGKDRDRAQPELARRAHDPDGDLTAVGDQHAADLGRHERTLAPTPARPAS
jgi:hypothetical protein